MATTTRFDKISASAVSGILGRAGFRRARGTGYSTGYEVQGVITAVYVYVQENTGEERQETTNRILGLFNNRPGYAATLETPSYMVGIDDSDESRVIHVRRPITVVDVEEVPEQTSKQAIGEVFLALNDKGFFLNLSADRATVSIAWFIPFSNRVRSTKATFDERSQTFETPHTLESFRTMEDLLAHVEEYLVEPGER